MEDIVIIESNDYAQVIFEDVQDTYDESKDLLCSFQLSEFLELNKDDFIGLYKVGFTNCLDYLMVLNLNLNEINEKRMGQLIFSGEKLPKEDGEFYQFVFMSMGKYIRGASVPFQFKRGEQKEESQLDEFKRREKELNEKLNEIKLKCENLSKILPNENYELIDSLEKFVSYIEDFQYDKDTTKAIAASYLEEIQRKIDDSMVKSQVLTDLVDLKEKERLEIVLKITGMMDKQKETEAKLEELIEKEQENKLKSCELVENFKQMKKNYESKLEESNGSCFALNMALTHLENRLKTNEKKYENENSELKRVIETLKKENENLEQRVRSGACDYALLNNKYMKLKNEKNLSKSFMNTCMVNDNDDIESLLNDSVLVDDCDIRLLKSPTGSDMTMVDDNSFQLNKSNHKGEYEQQGKQMSSSALSETSSFQNIDECEQEISTDSTKSHCENNNFPKKCEICDCDFPTHLNSSQFRTHVDKHMGAHLGHICPICMLRFRKGYTQEDFENHVNSHFAY